MEIEVITDDSNKMNKKSLFISDPHKIKTKCITNSSNASETILLTIRIQFEGSGRKL
jgi:hypothetical protein